MAASACAVELDVGAEVPQTTLNPQSVAVPQTTEDPDSRDCPFCVPAITEVPQTTDVPHTVEVPQTTELLVTRYTPPLLLTATAGDIAAPIVDDAVSLFATPPGCPDSPRPP